MPHRSLGISRKIKIIILPLISAVFTAVYVAMDKYYLSIISPDPYAYCFLSMWIGLIATTLFMVVMRIPFRKKQLIGTYIDPNFQGFIVPKGKLLLLLLIAGLSSAISTITYFYIVGVSSPSLVLPFTQIVIVYLIVSESLSYKETPTAIEIQSIIMILIGVFLMATTELSIDWITILLVLGPYNISLMIFTIALRHAKRMLYHNRKNDSLNLRFWSMIFNTLLIAVLIIPFISSKFYDGLAVLNSFVVVFIIITMLIATFSYITYIRALGIAKMSIVNAIISFSIVLGIPITIIGNLFYPGAFGSTAFTPIFWLFKSLGVLLILIGIITIGLSQVKAHIFIYLKGSSEPILNDLLKIKGITRVSAVSGERILIATLQLRDLGKAYRTHITDLEKIPGIEKIITFTHIKEWERL
ncbi:MAG: EamA family transporter [Promethearchaeota archaeon]